MTFHRQSRTRRDLRSELDDVPGIGPRRRKALLTRFGSVAGVRRATREELTRVVGAKGAERDHRPFRARPERQVLNRGRRARTVIARALVKRTTPSSTWL